MKEKLRLDLADLQVEGFSTAALATEGGTVHGFITAQCTGTCNTQLTCVGATCGGEATCNGEPTCNADGTCARSCGLCDTYYCGSGDTSCIQGQTCFDTCNTSCDPNATCTQWTACTCP